MAYEAGTAAIQIVPSFRGVQTMIDVQFRKMGFSAGKAFAGDFQRQAKVGTEGTSVGPSTTTSRKSGSDSGSAFADGFRKRLEAALKNLPEPKIGAATTEAEQKIRDLHAELRRLSEQRVGVDIDEATALAELARLQAALDDLGRNSPSVQVRTDVARASAELAAFQAQVDALDGRDVDIRVDDGGSIGRGMVGLSGLLASAVALSPALVPIGAVGLGAIGAIGPAAVIGATGLGVMALGFAGVSDAVKALSEQQAAANGTAEQQAAAQEKVNEAMAGMSPAGRSFATFLFGLREEFGKLRDAAQSGLLPGVQAGMEALLPVLPQVTRVVGKVAEGMGSLFESAGKALASPFWRTFLDFVGDNAQGAIEGFGAVIGNLAKGLAGLTMAFAPFAAQVGAGLVRLTQRFAEFGAGAGSNAFQGFLAYIQRVAPLVVATLGSLIGAIGHLLVALAPIGGVVLVIVKGFADLIRAVPTTVLTALLAVVITLTATVVAINAALRGWSAATIAANAVQRFFFTTTVAQTGAQRASTVSLIAHRIATVATSAATRAYAATQWLLNAALTANPIGIVVALIAALVAGLVVAYKKSETFRNIVNGVWKALQTAVSTAWNYYYKPILAALWNALKFGWEQFQKFQRIASAVFDGFKEHVRKSALKVADFFLGMAETVVSALRPIAKLLGFGDEVDAAVRDIRRMRTGINKELELIDDQNVTISVAAKGILAKNALRFANEHVARGRAQGGALPGAPSSVDNMLAPVIKGGQTWLQPLAGGEHIVSAREVQAAGGHAGVERWRRSLLPGRAGGGPVQFDVETVRPSPADIRTIRQSMNYGVSAITAGIRSAVQQAASEAGQLSGGGFRTASGGWPPPRLGVVSPNTAAAAAYVRERWGVYSGLLGSRPNKSDHPLGKALDAMTSNITKGNEIANYFASNPGAFGTKYAIWRQQINSGSGWRGMEDRGSTTANHMDHVHVSLYDKGGYLRPGLNLAYNGTGKPEPVLTAAQMSALTATPNASRAMVEIGTMIAADPQEAIRMMERRQSDAVALAGLASVARG